MNRIRNLICSLVKLDLSPLKAETADTRGVSADGGGGLLVFYDWFDLTWVLDFGTVAGVRFGFRKHSYWPLRLGSSFIAMQYCRLRNGTRRRFKTRSRQYCRRGYFWYSDIVICFQRDKSPSNGAGLPSR